MFSTVSDCDVPAGTAPAAPTPPREAAEVVGLLLQVAHRLRGVLSSHFAEFDLSDVRFHVLQSVRRSAHGRSQTELADELAQSESSISTLVERMRKDDLLYRLRSQDDRRKWTLTLTSRGRALLDRVDQCHERRMALLLRGIDPAQQRALADLLRRVLAELSAPAAIAAFERIPAAIEPPAAPEPNVAQPAA